MRTSKMDALIEEYGTAGISAMIRSFASGELVSEHRKVLITMAEDLEKGLNEYWYMSKRGRK